MEGSGEAKARAHSPETQSTAIDCTSAGARPSDSSGGQHSSSVRSSNKLPASAAACCACSVCAVPCATVQNAGGLAYCGPSSPYRRRRRT